MAIGESFPGLLLLLMLLQSSRRVSEVILSGCIPVFLGPPFHTLPLAELVNYQAFSVSEKQRFGLVAHLVRV